MHSERDIDERRFSVMAALICILGGLPKDDRVASFRFLKSTPHRYRNSKKTLHGRYCKVLQNSGVWQAYYLCRIKSIKMHAWLLFTKAFAFSSVTISSTVIWRSTPTTTRTFQFKHFARVILQMYFLNGWSLHTSYVRKSSVLMFLIICSFIVWKWHFWFWLFFFCMGKWVPLHLLPNFQSSVHALAPSIVSKKWYFCQFCIRSRSISTSPLCSNGSVTFAESLRVFNCL